MAILPFAPIQPPIAPLRRAATGMPAASTSGSNMVEASPEAQAEAVDPRDALQAAERERRSRDKEFAYRKILNLRERVRALKLLADANPGALPKAVAQLAKELSAAVKEYQEAGGKGGGALGSIAMPAASADAPEEDDGTGARETSETGTADDSSQSTAPPADLRARDAYRERQIRQRADELEADSIQDAAFVRDTRAIVKKLREFLQIGAQDRDPDSDEGKDAKEATTQMRKAEKTLDGLEGDANAARLTGKLMKVDA